MLMPYKSVFILARTEFGTYSKLAEVNPFEASQSIEQVASALTRGYPVKIIGLGLLEDMEFTSEDVSENFQKEMQSIINACVGGF